MRISLKPYPGQLYYVDSSKKFNKLCTKVFEDDTDCHDPKKTGGRMVQGYDREGWLTFVIWASDDKALIHELSHVILDLFGYVNINPMKARGEPFAYMMGHLFEQIKGHV
jgi:hypothetical protein